MAERKLDLLAKAAACELKADGLAEDAKSAWRRGCIEGARRLVVQAASLRAEARKLREQVSDATCSRE